MIVSNVFSKSIGFGFFLLILSSCHVPKDTLEYATIYRGETIAGFNARALTFVNHDALIIAGPKGVFCGKYFGGELIEQPNLKDAEDIRDVHIFNNGTLAFLNSGQKGRIYVVGYNGEQGLVYDSSGVFLDGFDFWDDQNGIAFGDPVDDKFFLIETKTAARIWTPVKTENFPDKLKNESGFAASGTSLQCIGDSMVVFATGMADTTRLFISYDRGKNWITKNTPMKAGENFGIYSIFFWNDKEGMIIGGNWKETNYKKKICFYTGDGGDTWVNRSKGLGGYSSCIQGNEDGSCIFATGDKGTYFTLDKGGNWFLLFERNYYSIQVNKDYVAFVGRDGAVEILRYQF